MNYQIREFRRLLRRTGLSKTRIESALRRKPLVAHGDDSICDLYVDAVKECCFQNRPDVLSELALYIETHKCHWNSMVNFFGINIQMLGCFPMNIILHPSMIKELFLRRMLSLLPTFIRSIYYYSDVYYSDSASESTSTSLDTFMFMVTPLHQFTDDEELITDGHNAWVETTQVFLDQQDEGRLLFCHAVGALIESIDFCSIEDVLSVKSIQKHFQLIIRLVELYINYRVDTPECTYLIVVGAAKKIRQYEASISSSQNNSDDLRLAKLNAFIDGLADVFRCFMLVRSYASTITIDEEEFYWHRPRTTPFESALTVIIRYSSAKGHSRKLLQLLLDALSSADVNKLKSQFIAKIRETPASDSDEFHLSTKRALECLNEVEFPHSLQYLSRQAIHRALWDRELPDAIQPERLTTHMTSLGLPECVHNYCVYS